MSRSRRTAAPLRAPHGQVEALGATIRDATEWEAIPLQALFNNGRVKYFLCANSATSWSICFSRSRSIAFPIRICFGSSVLRCMYEKRVSTFSSSIGIDAVTITVSTIPFTWTTPRPGP